MVNFNFGLGGSKTKKDDAAANNNAAQQNTTVTNGNAQSAVNNNSDGGVVNNPFMTNIPAAEDSIFVTPPAEPKMDTGKEEPNTLEVTNPFSETPSSESLKPLQPIFADTPAPQTENPFADSTANTSSVQIPEAGTPVALNNSAEVPTETDSLSDPVSVFQNDALPNVANAETTLEEKVVTPDLGAAEEPMLVAENQVEEPVFNPFAANEPTLTTELDTAKTEIAPDVPEEISSENNETVIFNPFEETEATISSDQPVEVPTKETTVSETMTTAVESESSMPAKSSLDFNPFSAADETESESDSEPQASVDSEEPVFNVEIPTFEDDDVLKVELQQNERAQLPNSESDLIVDFGQTDEIAETADVSLEASEQDIVAMPEDELAPAKETNKAVSSDPLQTLVALKSDIEYYISKQESDIEDLNADIDYHKSEIKDLRSAIKEKQKQIKDKRVEFETMIKDIEKTLSTKFVIKK